MVYILAFPPPGGFLPKLKSREDYGGGLHEKRKGKINGEEKEKEKGKK